jgi:hypothetical protein
VERNNKTRFILSKNCRKTTKKPTFWIGSFALFLAVPTGFEPAIPTIGLFEIKTGMSYQN